MNRGAWQVTVHGIARVGHDLATKQQYKSLLLCYTCNDSNTGKLSNHPIREARK